MSLTAAAYWAAKELESRVCEGDLLALHTLADLHEEGGKDDEAKLLRALPRLAEEALALAADEDCPAGGWFLWAGWWNGQDEGALAIRPNRLAPVGDDLACYTTVPGEFVSPWRRFLDADLPPDGAGAKVLGSFWFGAWTGLQSRGINGGFGASEHADYPYHLDVPRAAAMYGIPTEGRPYRDIEADLEKESRSGACETVGAVLYGADYPVRMPPQPARQRRTKTVTLGSSAGLYAPSMIEYVMECYRDRRLRGEAVGRVRATWPGLSDDQWRGLLSGRTPYTVCASVGAPGDDSVTFEVEGDAPGDE
jgi:hypothetical protein